ncbi:MAG: hypothetical protein V1874_14810 [Spirochaetota bacterium]
MTLRAKIFDSFAISKVVLQTHPLPGSKETDAAAADNIFTYSDPFDFFRKLKKSDQYVPVTQRGLRKSFERGITGIEFFIEMATSLRPLADEAQDIDEITRLLSQQKLTTNPNLHSVSILRNLIKDPNPEIALYAAEGLNTIENAFIEKIQRIKSKIKEKEKDNKSTRIYILYYLLGLLYFEFAGLLNGQRLIQIFYLKESETALKTAHEIENKNNKRILTALGSCYMLMGKNKSAIKIFTHLFSKNGKDRNLLLRLAECYYNTGDYQNVFTLATLASKTEIELDEISELIIYQWLLNI